MMKEYFSRLPLPECAVKVNDEYLERTIVGYRTSSVSGRNELSSDLFEKTIGDTGPTKYLYKKDKTRDILVQFALVADSRFEHEKLFNKLKGVLHADNSKFVFEDEPDVYYVGTVRDITCTRLDSSGSDAFASVGEIAIHCSDPYKYSTAEKKFTADLNADGILEMTIKNSGTKAVPIDYTITHNHENGYMGIVSENGVIQLGKIEEADGVNYTRSEVITNTKDNSWGGDPKWLDDKGINGENNTSTTQGSFQVIKAGWGDVLALKSTGSTSSNEAICNGAMKTITIQNPTGTIGSQNAYVYVNSWFETGLMGQTGAQTIAFLDENNKLICAQSINKNDTVGNTAYVDFWIGGGGKKLVKQVRFEPSYLGSQNPYIQSTGHSDMRKEGDKITFYWWGTYPSFVVPELKNVKVAKVQIFIGQYGNRGVASKFVTRNYFRRIYISADVERWKDVPNRYQEGDVIFIDGSEGRTYINGMVRMGDEVRGSHYFLAKPGPNHVKFAYSSFCSEPPMVNAKIREAWL